MPNSVRHTNKSTIRERIYRLSASILGVSRTELLDPISNLFLESLSEEIYKLSGEVENIEGRILDKLCSLLIPSTDIIAYPSHCVLHASSVEGLTEITPHTGFLHSAKNKKKTFSFYPACKTNIYNGDIRYFIHNGIVHTIERDLMKTLYARSEQRHNFDDHTFWLGIELDERINDILGLSFYFDFYSVADKREYLHLLPYTEWSIQGGRVPMCKGISFIEEQYERNSLGLFTRYDMSRQINNSIKELYDNHFLSVSERFDIIDKREKFPSELHPYFQQGVLDTFDKPLLWIKITCPRSLATEAIEVLQPSINAFPVVSKKLVSFTREIDQRIPIIPLRTEGNESLISVHKVSDSRGVSYYDYPVSEDGESEKYGIYSLRRGGYERYNHRDASEYLADITASLNNEVSGYFKHKKSIKGDVKKIHSQVNRLVKRLKHLQSNVKERYEVQNYLLLSPDNDGTEIFFVDYWLTDGPEANNINMGTSFSPLTGADSLIDVSSVVSLSKTTGGRYAPQADHKNHLYKQFLSKPSLLVTNEDITNFLLEEFDESVRAIELKKGFEKSTNPPYGFIRTKDVYITLHKEAEGFMAEKDIEYFRKALQANSPATYNYRVFFNTQLKTNK